MKYLLFCIRHHTLTHWLVQGYWYLCEWSSISVCDVCDFMMELFSPFTLVSYLFVRDFCTMISIYMHSGIVEYYRPHHQKYFVTKTFVGGKIKIHKTDFRGHNVFDDGSQGSQEEFLCHCILDIENFWWVKIKMLFYCKFLKIIIKF